MNINDTKKYDSIQNGLFSSDKDTVLKAIQEVLNWPKVEFVKPLIHVMLNSKESEVKEEIFQILGSLKVSGFESSFIGAIQDPSFAGIHKDLLAAYWNSGGKTKGNLIALIECSLSGGMGTMLEGFSILDSMQEAEEGELIEVQVAIKAKYESTQIEDEKKLLALMSQIVAEKWAEMGYDSE